MGYYCSFTFEDYNSLSEAERNEWHEEWLKKYPPILRDENGNEIKKLTFDIGNFFYDPTRNCYMILLSKDAHESRKDVSIWTVGVYNKLGDKDFYAAQIKYYYDKDILESECILLGDLRQLLNTKISMETEEGQIEQLQESLDEINKGGGKGKNWKDAVKKLNDDGGMYRRKAEMDGIKKPEDLEHVKKGIVKALEKGFEHG
ncbi:MAG: hypothetical protein AABY22_33770 [Nanoarchaeota archaeon]